MLQVIVNGLMIGGIYALVAVGLTMIFGVMKIVNFAQGEFLMIGMYLIWILFPLLATNALPYVLVIPVGILMAGFGLVIFRVFFNPLVEKDRSNFIVLTFGLSYLLQNVVQFIFGANYNTLPVSQDFKTSSVNLGGLFLMKPRLIAFGIVMIFVVMVYVFLNKTDPGRAMRATAENTTVSQSLGINTKNSFTLAFVIGTVFAGIAGLLLSPIYYVYPRVGILFSTTATCCCVLGGLGNITGALIGGLIIGMVEAFTSTYINLEIPPIAINLILLLILILKPNGLMGRGARKA